MVPDAAIRSPRFSGRSWVAFPALRAAYKRVSLVLEFRPETWDGVLLLAGERDDMSGDFLAVVLHQGFVQLRYTPTYQQLAPYREQDLMGVRAGPTKRYTNPLEWFTA